MKGGFHYSIDYSLSALLCIGLALYFESCNEPPPPTIIDTTTVEGNEIWNIPSWNPVFSTNLNSDSWDYLMVVDANVFMFKDTLRMIYVGSPQEKFQGNMNLGYAWSLDTGKHWNRLDYPIMEPIPDSWEYPHLCVPKVLVDGDTLRMWYGGGTLNDIGMKIGYAKSIDGINWIRHPDNLNFGIKDWYIDGVLPGPVIKDEGIFKLWFSGGVDHIGQPLPEAKWSTGYATSTNGIDWDVHNEPVLTYGTDGEFDENWALPGTVYKTDSAYIMWYAGGKTTNLYPKTKIAFAKSQDGLFWVKNEDNPEIAKSLSSEALYGPSVLKINGELYIWYTTWNPKTSIHYAERNN